MMGCQAPCSGNWLRLRRIRGRIYFKSYLGQPMRFLLILGLTHLTQLRKNSKPCSWKWALRVRLSKNVLLSSRASRRRPELRFLLIWDGSPDDHAGAARQEPDGLLMRTEPWRKKMSFIRLQPRHPSRPFWGF